MAVICHSNNKNILKNKTVFKNYQPKFTFYFPYYFIPVVIFLSAI